ncbi:MAG: hypothetical protein IKB99_10035, partial [Lentisphaeria bacterium]|nr:hypothetical protein [Lentisphaeria bacterium]
MKKIFLLLVLTALCVLRGAVITPEINGGFKNKGRHWNLLSKGRGTLSCTPEGYLQITRFKDKDYAD